MNAVRLLLGTLTVLPVRAPTDVDRRTSGWAMTLAPLAGAVLATLVLVPIVVVQDRDWPISPLLLAGLVLGTLAVLTRAIHLDGLADTADGLGSGRSGEGALAIMRQSDIGPFGVVTLLLALLIQAAALAQTFAVGSSAGLLVALVTSRTVLPLLCTSAFPAARRDGLGSGVAGSVSSTHALLAGALAVALVAGLLTLLLAGDWTSSDHSLRLALTAPLALLPALLLAWHCVRRLGGVTGDVYGACVEVTFTAALVVAAMNS